MLEKDNSPRSIRVRFTGFLTLFFFVGFILSLLITIHTATIDETGEIIYSSIGLGFNLLFTIGFVLSLLFFILFYLIRFIKQAKGPALKMTPKEEFKDGYDLGQHIADITTSDIGYSPFFKVSWATYRKDILTLTMVSLLSLGLGLYLVLSRNENNLGYALLVLFFISLSISLILLFVLPLLDRNRQNKTLQKNFSIYQDKIYFETNNIPQEYTFSMCHKSYKTSDTLIFIFYRDGQKNFFFQKKDMDNQTFEFLQLKAKQVNNNN